MEISDVAKQSGIPASTLRYYEERGLIRSTGRRGLRRLFDEDVLERLGLISLGRAAGFTLDEIAAMMSEEGPRIERATLMSKADELDEKIRQMTIMRDGLRHAANCRAPSHMECPSFRRILRAAMTGRISAKGNPVGLANRKG
ncbi:helix-turn-helix domain-containing protein [Hyphomonas sp. KY3]|jgi:DNA-binding transcriptional MerR regulator|uniref:helix-turn-helix domain-containing protein n=1 Tax=Hyphomonas sp. KY3 TaxID=2016196 RepID=UPI001A8C69C1|nr:helix-turn-helix domain-containing protein [Hyphomonas sp. KY3]QSR20970.1 MerR family transcriptional regulator [Hyphomonas sp. KY3]